MKILARQKGTGIRRCVSRTCVHGEKKKPDCDERFFTRSRGGVDATRIRIAKNRLAKKEMREDENHAFSHLFRQSKTRDIRRYIS